MNRAPLLAGQVSSNSVQHCRSQKTSRTRVSSSARTSVYRDKLVLRCAPREGVRVSPPSPLVSRGAAPVHAAVDKQDIYTFVVEFIAPVAFPTFYG